MCGLMSEYESVQNKIKNGYLFKIALKHRVHPHSIVTGELSTGEGGEEEQRERKKEKSG
ncbi:hypothetical protein JZ751_011078 [Albula glossodonta]|uniref:Uncharacterized protein n=1 Tax=Albula glossodonta TaxID=121402 RepID=A0A8T2P499_9TELE|nr:hypothetical protein JZ751_011078 [Albula glossodonta]